MLADELAADPTQIEILVAYDGRRPVATSLLRLHRGTQFGSIWGAATLPDSRRRGIYTALVDRHAATARMTGARLLSADANANSRPVLERSGFRALVRVQGFVWQCAG
jgi:ribosomal protein S18 acetylase RimI-like enzyme